MSTIGYENWAVDLADVGPIYPFQGAEVLMTVLCVVFWLGWHILQARKESADLEKAKQAAINAEQIKTAIERY
ncbi:MAG: hypothetical protein ABJL99_04410 [Aliishimia sp.]